MSRTTTYGTCALCGKHLSKAGMTRHIGSCAAQHEPTTKGQASRLLRLRIEDAWSPWYWMDVEIKANTTLDILDSFLRRQWLECCGHLSAFQIDGEEYTVSSPGADFFSMGGFGEEDEQDMTVRLDDVLGKGSSFGHIYDFGTSTQLKLRVSDERQGRIGREPLRLLSRNDPPEWTCDVCGQVATQICTTCMYDNENPFYCDRHAGDHDCEDPEMLLPVVNSPRMGQCAYEGPLQDEARA